MVLAGWMAKGAIVEEIGGAMHQAQGVEEAKSSGAVGKIEGEHCAERPAVLPCKEGMGQDREGKPA